MIKNEKMLLKIYNKLYKTFGPRHWWPADDAFEVIIGAILTQNTAWKNVEKAIDELKDAGCLSPRGLLEIRIKKLAHLIKSAGYYNIKAARLKHFIDFLFREFGGSLKRMFGTGTDHLRQKLLDINGIGPETADSILLYAGAKCVFVVDAYTRRVFSRHRIIKPDSSYKEIQDFFMNNLPRNKSLFNEYHALIVELGKRYCRKIPRCGECPLKNICHCSPRTISVRGEEAEGRRSNLKFGIASALRASQ